MFISISDPHSNAISYLCLNRLLKLIFCPKLVFLRELEYFRGIIFLTTNLLSTIDTAFRSRVHIHLVFSSLSFAARCMLWRKFLDRLPSTGAPGISNNASSGKITKSGSGISEDDIKALAKWNLNGREIKNAVKTVNTWCQCKGYSFEKGRLEAGILVTAPGTYREE